MPVMAQSADGVMHTFPDGTPGAIVDATMKQYAASNAGPAANDDDVSQAGAPAKVRALVGSMPDAATRLQAIQHFYPDAQPHGDDNFVYTDPVTKRPTMYNPTGLDWGDLASLAPEAAEMAGGAAGAVGGGAGGSAVPVVGTMVGGVAGAGAGATAAKEAEQRAAMASIGVKDDRTAGQQIGDAATTAALNAAGQGVGQVVGAGARALVRGVARGGEAGRTATQAAIDDLNRFGATPSVAPATGNSMMDSLESLTAKVPGGAGVIRQAARAQSEVVAKNLATKLANLNSNIAPNDINAGQAVSEGIDGFVANFQDRADVLYGKVGSLIPSDTPVPVTNTERTLAQIVTPAAGAPNVSKSLANPALVKLQAAVGQDASNGAMTYGVMNDLRSSIGRRLGSPSLVDDIPRGQLKQVYGALSDDLRMAAQNQGPDALKAFDRAGAYYKAGMQRIDTMLQPLVQSNFPGKVFAAVENSAQYGPTQIAVLRNSVTPIQWKSVAGAIVNKMGTARAGQQSAETSAGEVPDFSFQTFLTNWQKLTPDTKDAIFAGKGLGGMRADLDALERSAVRIRDSSKAFANPSGTAAAATGNAMIWGGVGASVATLSPKPLVAIMGAVTASHFGAKLLTSPTFVKWLAQSTRIAPAGMGAQIGRLSAIAANSDADTRNAIGSYLNALSSPQPQQDNTQ